MLIGFHIWEHILKGAYMQGVYEQYRVWYRISSFYENFWKLQMKKTWKDPPKERDTETLVYNI